MAHSFRDADHLPNRRAGRGPADPAGLPRQRKGTTPQMHGRYPDYDVLAEADHWDPVTRELILSRAREVPPVRFFTAEEAAVLRPFLDILLAQDAEPRVPVLEMVDKKFHDGKLDGFRHADLPPDPGVWRILARGLRERGFETMRYRDRHDLIQAFQDGKLSGGAWDELNLSQAWSVVTRNALSEFYSHPWAWNEIGFGGPSYPRGYMRLQPGSRGREPYEAIEAFGLDPVSDLPDKGDA